MRSPTPTTCAGGWGTCRSTSAPTRPSPGGNCSIASPGSRAGRTGASGGRRWRSFWSGSTSARTPTAPWPPTPAACCAGSASPWPSPAARDSSSWTSRRRVSTRRNAVASHRVLADIAADNVVLLSTHIVDDVESLCERLSILAGGRIVAEGTPAALIEPLEGRLWSRVVPRGEALPDDALHASATPAGALVIVEAAGSPGEVWAPHAPRLEDVYHAAIARAGVRDEEAVA